jgi:hypothetical protein
VRNRRRSRYRSVAFKKWENEREPSWRMVSIAMIRTFDGIGSSGPDVVLGRVRR